MTGFGKAEKNSGDISVAVEISSVNGRFLDLKMKTPRYLNEFEPEIRKIAQKYTTRGRVSMNVNVERITVSDSSVTIDFDLAKAYLEAAGKLAEDHGIESGVDAKSLLTLPDVIVRGESEFDNELLLPVLKEAIETAFKAHTVMRENEGEAIGADMKSRLATIENVVVDIDARAPEAVSANAERLRSKIEKLLGKENFDENRFTMELSLYADRVDITEEIVRLKSHCNQFSAELTGKKSSGKRLSFLLQEMNREANTIASKSSNADIAQLVVTIKEELEKLREQADNVE